MGFRGVTLAVVFVAALLGLSAGASAQQFAAVDTHATGTGPVVWGSELGETIARAVAACRRVSKTCSGNATWTNSIQVMEVFAYLCCTQPRLACTIGSASTKQSAANRALGGLSPQGYTACTVRHYLSAKTGKRM